MESSEYISICDNMINSTMQYIDTSEMQRLSPQIRLESNRSIQYNNAVSDSAPISLIYAPAGTGRYDMILDRIRLLTQKKMNILVLTMNSARASQLSMNTIFHTNVEIETFSDFAKFLLLSSINVNIDELDPFINILSLDAPDCKLKKRFIDILKTPNPRDRMTLLSLFVNKHIGYVTDTIKQLKHCTTKLAGVICQNLIWHLKNTCYKNCDAIIVEGVHNMSVPEFCLTLSYASKYKCNLFMIGYPDETIYEFNMAYKNAMNVLSGYADKNIHSIHLSETVKMSASVNAVLNMTPVTSLHNIDSVSTEYTADVELKSIISNTMDPNTAYIKDKLDKKEQLMFIAHNRQDLIAIAGVINEKYISQNPKLKIAILMTLPDTITHYGQIAIDCRNELSQIFKDGATNAQYAYELYNRLYATYRALCIYAPESKDINQIKIHLSGMKSFMEEALDMTSHQKNDINLITRRIVEYENAQINIISQKSIRAAYKQNVSDADIIISTIHSAADIRCQNVVVFLKNASDNIDMNLYRVALSRANESEYIIFANKGRFNTPYQRYLKQYT